RDREFNGGVSLFRQFAEHHTVTLSGFYQSIKLLDDNSKFIIGNPALNNPAMFERKQFVGAKAEYDYQTIKDKLFPVKGVRFSTGLSYTQNLKEAERNVAHLSG